MWQFLVCQISGSLFQHIRAFGCCEDGSLFSSKFRIQPTANIYPWIFSIIIFHVCFITMKKYEKVTIFGCGNIFSDTFPENEQQNTVAPPPSFLLRVSVTLVFSPAVGLSLIIPARVGTSRGICGINPWLRTDTTQTEKSSKRSAMARRGKRRSNLQVVLCLFCWLRKKKSVTNKKPAGFFNPKVYYGFSRWINFGD